MENNIKKLRHGSCFTLQDLSDRTGIAKSHIHNLESECGGQPRIITAYAIAKVFGVSVYDVWPDTIEIIEEEITIRRVVKK